MNPQIFVAHQVRDFYKLQKLKRFSTFMDHDKQTNNQQLRIAQKGV